ncbi:hypothetical protein L6452_08404 [Arctium lappa]|uniref:Uncharacterized protein n=1 Tax=Arctium lappa TaxID=4217 RepID=A0ACB9DH54_ARCLA|nr:hypothetical protein L6452_08404 [Arctium lappa]
MEKGKKNVGRGGEYDLHYLKGLIFVTSFSCIHTLPPFSSLFSCNIFGWIYLKNPQSLSFKAANVITPITHKVFDSTSEERDMKGGDQNYDHFHRKVIAFFMEDPIITQKTEHSYALIGVL